MKNLLPVFVLSCALLSGCGAPASGGSTATPAASEAVTVSDTEAETCEQLYTGDTDAPFPASVSLMGAIFTEGPVEPITAEQQAEIEDTKARMSGIASTANEELKDLVDRAYRPLNVLMANGYDTGGVSVEDYKEAASELLKRCPPPSDVVFDASANASPTSRDWVSELVAIGYRPGPDGGQWLDDRMREDAQPFCNASLTGPGESTWTRYLKQTEFEAAVLRGAKAADPEMELGYFLKVLERYCPDRVEAFDTVLKLHPELGPPKGRS